MDCLQMCTAMAQQQAYLNTKLLQATAGGVWVAVERLLAARADPNCHAYGDKRTPLHLAVSRGDAALETVVALLDAGANPTSEDAEGVTPWRAVAAAASSPLAASEGFGQHAQTDDNLLRLEMLRPRERGLPADADVAASSLPAGVDAFLQCWSLGRYSTAVALWCRLERAESVPELLSAPRSHFEAMGFGTTALRRIDEARVRFGLPATTVESADSCEKVEAASKEPQREK
eukprot:TRINITY_DN22957_c0_g1_i1.p1 TRINITY_DN22957_c0_g1~~TRINITY_DN22957_c0_g1_i1.p1  ORF type:complete len:232 (-),score=42.56 TRINITY_DN22957_c0_g1_i1:276-971(-)